MVLFKNRFKILFQALCLFLLLSLKSVAQPAINYAAIKEKYPTQQALFLKNEEVFNCKISQGKLDVKSDNLMQVLYLNNKLNNYAEQSIVYSPGFYNIESLNACTYLPEGEKYKKVNITTIKDMDYTKGVSFYDGSRAKKFYFEGLGEKVITETKYRYRYEDPSFLGSFFFKRGVPCLQSICRFVVDKDIEIGYKFFGDTTGIQFESSVRGNETIYTWELKNAPELREYGDAVSSRHNEPHLFVYIKSYKAKKEYIHMYNDVATLYKHEFLYIENINKKAPLPGLKSVVDSIVQASSSESQIAKGVYSWVQQNLKYVAFENGYGGVIPREANDVFSKKYGDCKDFASIITNMLSIANIKAYMVWIGTRDLPYRYEELPLGYSSNHMIAATYQNNEWVFLDGTSKHSQYGVPSTFIQGKEGLISITPDSFLVVTVPTMPASYSQSKLDVMMKLDVDKHLLTGTSKLRLNGYNHASWAGSLYYSGSDKVESQMKDFLMAGNNKFSVSNLGYTNLFNNDSPLVLNYDFTLPNYVKVIDQDIYINMNLQKSFINYKIDTTNNRTIARQFEYTWQDETRSCLIIPDGYKVKKMPENLHYEGADLFYSFSYSIENNCVCFSKKSGFNRLEVQAQEFNNWNAQMDKIFKSYNDLIILSKK